MVAVEILLLAIVSITAPERWVSAAGHGANEVFWDFDSSADDWAKATSVEMDAEIQWKPPGTIRGTVRGPSPHLDSPPFRVMVNDRHHVAMRMRSSGAATLGRLELRTGRLPGETNLALDPWTARGNASVLSDESSSGGSTATLAADGDLTTLWETADNTNEWVTLDLGDARDVTALRLQAPGGDTNPRNVRLQRGLSAGGKFANVASLTLGNSSDAQEFNVPPSRGRFWRVYVLDGHGANRTSLREVELLGPGDTAVTEPLDFQVVNDNAFHVYYIPIHRSLQGVLTQLRLRPGVEAAEPFGRHNASLSPARGDSFEIDWIRIVRAPRIKRVRGCIDEAYGWPDTPETGRDFAVSNVTAQNGFINDFLELGRTRFGTVEGAEYGSTKSCLVAGGETLTISGAAFGITDAQVYVDGSPCTDVEHTPGSEDTEIKCISPPITAAASAAITAAAAAATTGAAAAVAAPGEDPVAMGFYKEWMSTIEVVNGRMPGLKHGVEYFSYQAPPPPIGKPSLSNIAARSIDVSWEPPADYWHALAVTGYQVGWRSVGNGLVGGTVSETESELGAGEEEVETLMTVGNVTTTTVRGLIPGVEYAFWVRGLSESRSDVATEEVDLYGRREPLKMAVTGVFSEASDAVATLEQDILFERFNANLTLNHSAAEAAATLGPRGQWAGEGHYGMQLVGTAQIENCNKSVSCCDGYDEESGSCVHGEEGFPYYCAASTTTGEVWPLVAGSSSSAQTPLSDYSASSLPPFDAALLPSSTVVGPLEPTAEGGEGWGSGVSRACGPALRLTASRPASAGAAWYPRDVTVGEGFDTNFTFRMSAPSLRCNTMDGVHTHCRSRGADGVAFVVQGESSTALGKSGQGMGYAGISNMLAVEFDTYFNPDLLDPYDNHVSVQTRGWRYPGSAHGSFSLGSTPNVPDLTNGEVAARVVYTPTVTPEDIFHPAFQASRHVEWGRGVGILRVYVENFHKPCLLVPINVETTLRLNHGRAFVGFTAATGRDTWQVHDVLRWSFSSLRQDTPSWPAPTINGVAISDVAGLENASCVDGVSCVTAPEN